jgi:septum formation topological specificity factor MinE
MVRPEYASKAGIKERLRVISAKHKAKWISLEYATKSGIKDRFHVISAKHKAIYQTHKTLCNFCET